MNRVVIIILATVCLATACSQGNVFDLGAGDCFDDPNGFDEVSDVEMVDCSEAHDNEVYTTFEVDGGDFPGESAVQSAATDGCLAAFDGYVGRDYATSALDYSALTPTSQSWAQGDREVVCFLYDLAGDKLTTSARGTGL